MSELHLEDFVPKHADWQCIKRSLVHGGRAPLLSEFGLHAPPLTTEEMMRRGELVLNVWYDHPISLPVYDRAGQTRIVRADRLRATTSKRRNGRHRFHIVCPKCHGEHIGPDGAPNLLFDACPALHFQTADCAICQKHMESDDLEPHMATYHPREAPPHA